MSELKNNRLASSLSKALGEYVSEISNGKSLITVTKVDVEHRGRLAKVAFTVFPEEHEEEVLRFLQRKKRELGDFIKSKIAIGFLPKVEWRIDNGQKKAERLFEISRKEQER